MEKEGQWEEESGRREIEERVEKSKLDRKGGKLVRKGMDRWNKKKWNEMKWRKTT